MPPRCPQPCHRKHFAHAHALWMDGRLDLVLFDLHASGRRALHLLGANLVPVGGQHGAVGLLKRLVHRAACVLIRAAVNLAEQLLQGGVALQLLLLLLLLHLRLDLVPVLGLPAPRRGGGGVRRTRRAGAGERRRRRRGGLQRGPVAGAVRLGQPDLDLGAQVLHLAALRIHRAREREVQRVLQLLRVWRPDVHADGARGDADLRALALDALGHDGQRHRIGGLVPLVPVLALRLRLRRRR
mmetsp:Transcript_27676/g.71819  ORF Transcript_27676/g.71819 Transcript_27676/m.71819 type:complete len:241 (+) Transcript_27676:46-768(+)